MLSIFQILLAISLFFIINIIGKYSPTSFRYYQISGFLQTDEAPAFNFSFRVLTPVVFIILISAILYSCSLDAYVKNIYIINIYYVAFRAIFTISIQRTSLVNWKNQLIYAVCIIALSYFIYSKFIIIRKNLLPDFSNLANELWIIILLFLYNLINSVPSSDERSEKRKRKYIGQILSKLKLRYGTLIDSKTDILRLKHIIFGIIIYENFNRPKLFRIFEYISYYLNHKPATFGIMQVRSNRPLSDQKSVEEGVMAILMNYQMAKTEYNEKVDPNSDNWELKPANLDNMLQDKIIREYNHCDDYTYEIKELADYINENFYNNLTSSKTLFH